MGMLIELYRCIGLFSGILTLIGGIIDKEGLVVLIGIFILCVTIYGVTLGENLHKVQKEKRHYPNNDPKSWK